MTVEKNESDQNDNLINIDNSNNLIHLDISGQHISPEDIINLDNVCNNFILDTSRSYYFGIFDDNRNVVVDNAAIDGNDASENDASQNDASGNDASGNDASGNDASGNDTSQNDASQNDASGNDTSQNDISGNDICINDIISYLETPRQDLLSDMSFIPCNSPKLKPIERPYSLPSPHTYMLDDDLPKNYLLEPIPEDLLDKKKEYVQINTDIGGLDDLINLIEEYPILDCIEYNINMVQLHGIKKHLVTLKNMIGMQYLKDCIVDQIIYYIQGFHTLGNNEGDYMHTVIYGPPGTGKTEVAKIIGSIFSSLGILSSGKFIKVTRADLVAGYVGQTAIKTRDVIEESLGGVLFIDEAYSLGNDEKQDSFAKECIDTLCEALSTYKDSFMVIIAGYEEELKSCLFNHNKGLESRFTWRYHTCDYSPEEMREIFIKKVNDAGWSLDDEKQLTATWFSDNIEHFKYFGRDMETLFTKTKICHSRRVFCNTNCVKTRLAFNDIENGLALYLRNGRNNKENHTKDDEPNNMYI